MKQPVYNKEKKPEKTRSFNKASFFGEMVDIKALITQELEEIDLRYNYKNSEAKRIERAVIECFSNF